MIMNPAIFEFIKDEHLTKPFKIIKLIGKTCLAVSLVALIVAELALRKMGGGSYLDLASVVIGLGLIIGMICFAIVGLVSTGKTDNNSSSQAIVRSLKKVFLFLFLPAIVITMILFVTLTLIGYY